MAAILASASIIANPSVVDHEPLGERKRDVLTELNYWKRLENPSVAVDFGAPDASERYGALDELDEPHRVQVHDVRGDESNYTLERNGFQYIQHEIKELKDLSNEEQVKEFLLPATEELVRQVTNATKVMTFTHRIRCFAADERKLGGSQAPAHSVHSDFTPTGALQHIQQAIKDEPEIKCFLDGRVLIINVWRPLKQIHKDPLAVCDWNSVDPETDLVAHRLVFSHGWNELAKASFSPKHMWYYLSDQRPDEPLLFIQYDSRAKDGMNLLHTAFVDPQFIDDKPRESIEIKMFAFYPN